MLDFDHAPTSFAVCSTGRTFVVSDHIAITTANVYVNTGTQMGNEFDWFFNPVRNTTPYVPGLPAVEPSVLGGPGLLTAAAYRLRRRGSGRSRSSVR